MLKKITACLFVVFFMLSVFTVSVSADGSTTSTGSSGAEHGGSSGKFGDDDSTTINLWSRSMFDKYLHDYDFSDISYDNLLDISRKTSSCIVQFDKKYNSGLDFLSHCNFFMTDADMSYITSTSNSNVGAFYASFFNRYQYFPHSDGFIHNNSDGSFQSFLSVSYNGTYSDNYCYIVSDIDVYRSLVSQFPSFSDQIWFCDNFVNSFLSYINNSNYDFNPVVPPAGFSKNAIKYSNFLDCPYGIYGAEPYENETDNYVTSGLFTDLDLYYSSKFIKGTSSTDHNEDITFYIPAVDIKTLQLLYKDVNIDWSSFFTSAIGASSSSFDFSSWYKKWYLLEDNPAIDNINWDTFFEKHFRSVHYENDSFTPLDFFNDVYNKKYTSFNDFVKLKSIKGKLYIVFTMSSKYSVTHTGVGTVPGGGSNLGNDNAVFTGTRVTHTATRFDPKTGEVGKNKDGLGSDISQADDSLSRPPTKDELADLGFDYGYPNTQGDFPYTLTMYRNGVEYFKMYFSKKPSVTSDYYSDKCIKYGFNVDNMKIYMYFKEQNMSRLFDFTNKENFTRENNPYWEDSSFVGKDITDTTLKILSNLMNIDTSEFSNTYTLYAWTNYTGEFPKNYNGFYCKFNWDLEKSGHFQKNNSDDNYDYSQDYEPDEGVKDNNGNTHGGAVEKPTEAPSYNGFNNSDFQFDENNLWNYATSFLNFCAKAFLILPAFIWQLIACSIVIIIILRIAGR